MEHSNIIYLMAIAALLCMFSFLLTKDNENIARMAFIINIMMSCFLMLIGEMAIFLSLVFLNFLIFFMAKVSALEEAEKKSFQEPFIDIPVIIIIFIIVGLAAITIFQNIDFLRVGEIESFQLKAPGSIDFKKYADLISIIFVVFISVILFFNIRVLKK